MNSERHGERNRHHAGFADYEHELNQKLAMVISIAGIVGAVLALLLNAFIGMDVVTVVVQSVSFAVFVVVICLIKTRGWTQRLSLFIVCYTLLQLTGSWAFTTLADHITRILLFYTVIVMLVLLSGRLRVIFLCAMALYAAFMLYYDTSTMVTRYEVIEYFDLVIDSLIIGGMIILIVVGYKSHLKRKRKSLYEYAIRDPLTGAYNVRYFTEKFTLCEQQWHQSKSNYAIAIIDVDDFKAINDTYGHQRGDRVLCTIAGHLSQSISAQNAVIRYGGDEFIVLFSAGNVYSAGEALAGAAANINSALRDEDGLDVSLSIGLCDRNEAGGMGEDIRLVADRRMYKAKARSKSD